MLSDFAIIETGGKQYRVAPGDVIRVEMLPEEERETVTFERVLLMRQDDELRVGRPTVEGAQVNGRVLAQGKDKKVTVFKYKPKVRYRIHRGHRQRFTDVQIEDFETEAG